MASVYRLRARGGPSGSARCSPEPTPFMKGHEIGPALGPCEVPVGHPALDVEGGLYVRLPRTTSLYLFLVDVQGFVDRKCLVGPEDGPAVGDDGFGRAVALHRRVKDREVRREILAAKDPTSWEGPLGLSNP